MAKKQRKPKLARGRGTKPERKAQRRALNESGQGPVTPARSDYASKDAWKRRQGIRRLGPGTVDAPGKKSPVLPGTKPRALSTQVNRIAKGSRRP